MRHFAYAWLVAALGLAACAVAQPAPQSYAPPSYSAPSYAAPAPAPQPAVGRGMVGLVLGTTPEGAVVVTTVVAGSPADEAGVPAGAELVSVAGESSAGWTLAQAVAKLRGEPGTTASFSVRDAVGVRDFTLTRRTIDVPRAAPATGGPAPAQKPWWQR